MKACELVGRIYDALLEQYVDKTSAETLHSLNVLCVRLVFCLYAEDAGLFGNKTAFHDYLAAFPANHIRRALIELFGILNTPSEFRDPYTDPVLAQFPYVNGGLFGKTTVETHGRASLQPDIEIPNFTEEIKQLLLQKASADFDWNEISPTIFGSLFESTLNPETRRKGRLWDIPSKVRNKRRTRWLFTLMTMENRINRQGKLTMWPTGISRRRNSFKTNAPNAPLFPPTASRKASRCRQFGSPCSSGSESISTSRTGHSDGIANRSRKRMCIV